jgi:hypothetical protein
LGEKPKNGKHKKYTEQSLFHNLTSNIKIIYHEKTKRYNIFPILFDLFCYQFPRQGWRGETNKCGAKRIFYIHIFINSFTQACGNVV